jgi:hypothetical protein
MTVKIILISMVKNEGKIIERLMASVVDHIDGYVICDTGSTDNTIDLATNFMKTHNKEGCVVSIPWVNFGISRTLSVKEALNWVNENKWDNKNTWGLLLDGDMIMPDAIDKRNLENLKFDSVGLNQKNTCIIYKNTRLLRMTKEWKCIGPTHEYWDTGPGATLENPVIQDLNDGGCKSDKFKRDIRMLKEELNLNQKHDRTLFYLGQSYQSIQKYKKSNAILNRRIKVGGWTEEIYMAHMYIGNNFIDMKKEEKAVCEWIKAWNVEPKRTEAAIKLIRYYRGKQKMQFVAMTFLEKLIQLQFGKNLMGIQIGNPVVNDCVLFIEHDNIKAIWKEMAILSYYTGHKKEAYITIDSQILSPELNFNERNDLLGYQKWYDWILKTNNTTKIEISADMLPWKNEPDWNIWNAYNPSIRVCKNEYDIILRHSNYSTTDAKSFPCRGRTDYIITRNVLCKMDADFQLKNSSEIIVKDKFIVNTATQIRGLEDCRLIQNSCMNLAFATNRQYTESKTNKISIVYWKDTETNQVDLKKTNLPENVSDDQCQKNWLPFCHNSKSYFIYSINPFVVCSMKSEKILEFTTPHFNLDGLRGSTAPVHFTSTDQTESYIMIVHYCFYSDEGRRYYNRFVSLDKNLLPVRLSGGFKLSEKNIEYVSGMCKSLKSKDMYSIGYGINDSEAYIASIESTTIDSLLWYNLQTGKTDEKKRFIFAYNNIKP